MREWKERDFKFVFNNTDGEVSEREWHALCVCIGSHVLNFSGVFAYITKQILSYIRRSEVCCFVCVCTVTQLGFFAYMHYYFLTFHILINII